MRYLLTIITIICLISCQLNNKDVTSISKTNKRVQIDTIQILSKVLNVKKFDDVVEPYVYHESSIDTIIPKHNWQGLFLSHNHFAIKNTDVKLVKAFDELAGDGVEQKTGWKHVYSVKDTASLLFNNLHLPEGPINKISMSKDHIYPGDTVTFGYKGKSYSLTATGDKKIDKESGSVIVSNYKLYISATAKGHHFKQLLVSTPTFYETFDVLTEILFAGDLDGDDIPDLVINDSDYVLTSNQTIYLSKPAGNKAFLIVVGRSVNTE